MPQQSRPAAFAFSAALLAAIITAWAAKLGFRTSEVWVLIVVAIIATATAYRTILAGRELQRLGHR